MTGSERGLAKPELLLYPVRPLHPLPLWDSTLRSAVSTVLALRRPGVADRQATGTVSASPIVSSAIMAATAEIVNTSSADAAISAYSASSSSVSITTSAAVASASAAASSSTSSNATASVDAKAVLTPNGIKAGMTLCTGIDDFSGKLGWCYGMSPNRMAT